jgi:hypothetical protein
MLSKTPCDCLVGYLIWRTKFTRTSPPRIIQELQARIQHEVEILNVLRNDPAMVRRAAADMHCRGLCIERGGRHVEGVGA